MYKFLCVTGSLLSLGIAQRVCAQEPTKPRVGVTTVAGGSALASQVNDPTAPITLLQLRNVIAPAWSGSGGGGNLLQAQFVFPIAKGRLIPVTQLSRITLPFAWLPPAAGGEAGFGDIEMFDLGLVRTRWGHWGVGLSAVIPSGASTTSLTQGKWQLGPSAAVILSSVPNLEFGLVLQNPISIAGPSERPDVNSLTISPTLTYNLPKGWFVGYSDFVLSFDWTDGGAATIPVGVQVGKLVKVRKRAFVLSAEWGTMVARASDEVPEWLVGLEAAWIIEAHPLLR